MSYTCLLTGLFVTKKTNRSCMFSAKKPDFAYFIDHYVNVNIQRKCIVIMISDVFIAPKRFLLNIGNIFKTHII